jgi:hypothetical protein
MTPSAWLGRRSAGQTPVCQADPKGPEPRAGAAEHGERDFARSKHPSHSRKGASAPA